jgi:TetR/AcrR family transcriptional regulator, cholesterol catabolism regulator
METRPRDGAKTSAEIREAAAELFYKHGYEATSLRAVAAEVGIKVGSLYNHMGSKDELLLDIMVAVMDQVTPLVESAAAGAGPDPISRLEAAIGAHIRFHAQHARETFIGNSELRALLPEQRRLISKRRHDYEKLMQGFIEEAAASVPVALLDSRLQTYAVLALGMHTASWFRDTSGVSLDQIVSVYTELSLRQIGVASAPKPARRKSSRS